MNIKSIYVFATSFLLLTVTSVSLYAQANECTFSTKTVEANGAMLHYFECGEGEPLVFIHGSTGDLSWANAQTQFFASQYLTISYSRRYHYPNDPPEDGDLYALQLHVDDLTSFVTELELGPVHIVGHSYGGYVALSFAMEHPDLVRSLVLGEPPVLPLLSQTSVGDALLKSFQKRVIIPSRQAYEKGSIEEGLKSFLNGVIYPGWFEGLPTEAQKELVQKAGPEHRLEMLTTSSQVMPPIACNSLADFDKPILLLTGEESEPIFFLVTAELEKCFSVESHVMVPEVGHGMFSNVSFTNDVIQTFLRGQE